MESRLSILMETFAISGKDLSGLLHIDSSLVSKWRSGKRYLKPNSVYTNQIIKHIMALDKNNQHAKVRMMMASEYINIFKCSENEVALFLKDWLTSTKGPTENVRDYFDEIRNIKSAASLTTYSLQGNTGRRQAVQFFLQYAQHVSPGVELWLYMSEGGEWFDENPAFLDEWRMRHMRLLQDENHVKIIHPISGSYENTVVSILTWMPMHMTGHTEAYIIQRYRDEKLEYTFMLNKDHMALYNWTQKVNGPKERNTYITQEPQFVKDIEVMLQQFFSDSTAVFQRYYYETRDDFFSNLVAVMERDNSEYHWCSSFPMFQLSQDLLNDIMDDNGIYGEQRDICLESFSLIGELSEKSQRSYIIDLDHLKQLLKEDWVASNIMSFPCGKTILLSHDNFVRAIKNTLEKTSDNENVKMCIASAELLSFLADIEIVAKENTSVYFSSVKAERARVLVTREITVATAIYSYFDDLWNTTPYLCRNKEYITKRVLKLIEEIEAVRNK